jgi:hypothetical protein
MIRHESSRDAVSHAPHRHESSRAVVSRRVDPHVALILLVALALRVAVWWTLPYRDFVSDEAEYWGAAVWLAQGRGFSFFDGWIWTRPPVYLLFLAIHAFLFGPTALWTARATQTVLSVALVYLVMRVAQRLAPADRQRPVALLTGWAMALSYSFATFGYLLLNETIFLLLFLAGVLALLRWADSRHMLPLIAVGGLMGLSVLTKTIVLAWLPFAALWIAFAGVRSRESGVEEDGVTETRGHGDTETRSNDRRSMVRRPSSVVDQSRIQNPRPKIVAAAIFTIAVCAVVLPWSAYATQRWSQGDGIILVDTTGGYNFALGAQTARFGQRDETALHDRLCEGPRCGDSALSQAARQQTAYALGMEWLRESPAGFARKTGRELLDMIQIQYGGAERLRQGHTAGAVPLPHLLGLLADDTLYFVAAILAPLGLMRRQDRTGKGLITSWLLYNIVVGALIFAINRFRQPLLPFVFIYAACAVVQWRDSWTARWRRGSAYALSGLLILLILPSLLYWPPFLDPQRQSSLQNTIYGVRGLRNAAECESIQDVLQSGDVARARELHDSTSARQPRDCLALINARILESEGRIEGPDGALAFLARSAPPNNQAQAARILLLEGDLLRRLERPDDARARFAARPVEIVNDLSWSWRELDPPANTRIDLGDGLDEGYLRGFYKREFVDPADPFGSGFRWSGPESWLRFVGAGSGRSQTLVLRLNGYTNNPAPTRVTPHVGDAALPAITLEAGWQEIAIDLPPTPPGEDVIVRLESSVFVDGPRDLEERMRSQVSQPLRLLGFQLDRAELRDED